MPSLRSQLVALLCALLPAALGAAPDKDLRPPFGLNWSESPEHLEALLRGAKARVMERRLGNGREGWVVEGIIQPGLKRTIFYFRQNRLQEIELQYEHPQWDAAKFEEFFGQVRKNVETKYAPGRLVTRNTETRDGVTHSITGYQWDQADTSLQLFLFTAQQAGDAYRAVSLHYRAR